MIQAPITVPRFEELGWVTHGFGLRNSILSPEIRTAKQIHSNIVLDAVDCAETIREGDALISSESGVVVGVKTADCVPILLADPVTRTVAAVHAGWRGTAADIAGVTVRALQEKFGVRPGDLIAAIGPSIGPCCYEVGAEVAVRFGALNETVGTKTIHLDLPFQNEVRLRDAGVMNIWRSGECTYCRTERFFSYRREREQAGRMVSFIGQRADSPVNK